MRQIRLFFLIAAIVALGYAAVHRGLVHDFSLVTAPPSPSPTPFHRTHRARRTRHYARTNRSIPEAMALGRGLENRGTKGGPVAGAAPKSSATALAALHNPASNALEIPSAGGSSKPPAAASTPKPPFPNGFEGCWETVVSQPDAWDFNQGPVVQGWSPASYVLCFRRSGNSPQISFSTTSEYPVISDWVVSKTGGESSHTEVLFSGEDLVVLRTSSTVPLHMKILGFLPGPTGIISSRADFHCSYLPTDRLLVEASVVRSCSDASSIGCKGNIWIRESWHREFTRQSP
jgi:hypothetical protein